MMPIFKEVIIRDSIGIATTPERIWDFFYHLDTNYRIWHPDDHILFKWVRGKPMGIGSEIYAEETMDGHFVKLKSTVIESVPNKKIVFKNHFPTSFITPRIEWRMEAKGPKTVFTAITYNRIGWLFRTFAKNRVDHIIKIAKKHMREEGENLKRILEASS
jgi:hypothetical protein